jgi:hypothetical protein
MFDVRLFKGLREPYKTAQLLGKAEKISGFWKRLILLLVITFILASIGSIFGIGNDILSKELNNLSNTGFEATKSLFAIGQIIRVLIEALLIITIPSLFFWAVSDKEWKKFMVVQQYVLVLFLLEKLLLLPFAVFLGLTADISNPFSLGIIGQYLTNNEFILLCLAQISIFKIWAVVLQFKYIKELIESTAKRAALYVIGFNIVILLIVTFFNMMDLEKLL